MSITMETLELEIVHKGKNAASAIDLIEKSLRNLKITTKGGAGLTTIANQITRLNSALSNISFNQSSLKAISNLKPIIEGLSSIPKSSGLNSNIKALSDLPKVIDGLKAADLKSFNSQIQQLVTYMKPLASEMEKVSQGFSKLPSNIQKAITANEKLTKSASKSYGGNGILGTGISGFQARLATYYYGFRQVSQVIGTWIDESASYMENLNLFTVAMGEYALEAQEYAETVSEIMGIDPSEWMRNQGVFMTLATGFGVSADRAEIMSKNLTQLGYDLSSFFNLPFEESMLKLQSGISGELEPLRRLGYDLSQARLEAVALSLGIDQSVSSMTQAEKAQLRYYAIMTQVTTAQGDMARTLEAPANQLRILQAQIDQLTRSLGNVFIPIINKILPYIIAFVKALRLAVQEFANFLGFELPEVDYSSLGNIASGAEDVADSLDDATGNAKELRATLLGIDEINRLDDNTSNTGLGNSSVSGGLGLDFELPQYDFLQGLDETLKEKSDALVDDMKKVLDLVIKIGAGILAWKIGTSFFRGISNLYNAFNSIKSIIGKINPLFSGIGISISGFITQFLFSYDIGKNGINIQNFLGTLLGGGVGIAGATLAFGTTGLVLSIPFAIILPILGISFGKYSDKQEEIWEAWINSDTYKGIQLVMEDARSSVEVVKEITVNLEDKIQGIENVDEKFETLRTTASRLFDLIDEGANPAIIKGYVDEINSYNLDGLKLEYDEVTNTVNMSEQAVMDLIDAMKEQAKTAAYMDYLEEAYSAQAQLEIELNKQMRDRNDVLKELNELQDRKDYLLQLDEEYRALNQSVEVTEEQIERMKEIDKILDDPETGLMATSVKIDDVSKNVDELNGYVEGTSTELDKAKKSTEDVEAAFENYKKTGENASNDVKDSIGDLIDSISNAGDKTIDLVGKLRKLGEQGAASVDQVNQAVARLQYPDVSKLNLDFSTIKTTADYLHAIGVPGYASGGFPTQGQLFIAREAGPEMVGTIGSKTAVANNNQITAGIASAVYQAISSANGIGGGDITIQIMNQDGTVRSEQIISAAERRNRRDGKTVIPIGV